MYNIFYDSPTGVFIWNGITLDEITDHSDFIIGNVFHKDNLNEEIVKCQEVIRQIFPNDINPNIRYTELPLS